MKQCTKCSKILSLDNFTKHKQASDGLTPSCRLCEKARKAISYRNNPEKHKLISSRWSKNNKDRLNASQRKRRKQNEERTREYLKLYKRKSRLNIKNKLADSLRNRLYSALKGKNKSLSLNQYLGCSIEFLKQHLESKWQPGMSWDNWTTNGWHIDHIIPISSFQLDTEDDIKKACHYTNLQPLWAKDNLSKGNSYVSL